MVTKKYSLVKIILPLFIIVLIVFLFNFNKTAPFLKNTFFQIFSPIQKAIISLKIGLINAGEAISDFKNLKAHNERLIKENKNLIAESARLGELVTENDALRRALDLKINQGLGLQKADVIGHDLNKKTIVINAGAIDGIEKGMPVMTAEKALMGKIETVFKKNSIVRLIVSEDSAFDAKVADKDIAGIIKGKNGGLLSMELVPRGKEIKEGDVVLTTREGGIYPAGTVVGRVTGVNNNSLEPFLAITVKPASDFGLIRDVFIIIDF